MIQNDQDPTWSKFAEVHTQAIDVLSDKIESKPAEFDQLENDIVEIELQKIKALKEALQELAKGTAHLNGPIAKTIESFLRRRDAMVADAPEPLAEPLLSL